MAQLADLITDCTDAIRVGAATDHATRALNGAYREVCLRLRLLQTTAIVTALAAQDVYSWSSDFGLTDFVALIDMTRLMSGTTDIMRPALQVAEQEIQLAKAAMPSLVAQSLYCPIGPDKVMIWPQMGVGETMPITYVQRPLAMAGGEDEPSAIPEEFHDILIDGALQRLWRMQRGPEAHTEQRRCRNDFENGIQRLRSHLATQGGQTPQRVRVGYPSIPRSLIDNDTYLSGRPR